MISYRELSVVGVQQIGQGEWAYEGNRKRERVVVDGTVTVKRQRICLYDGEMRMRKH